jgi:hypothetical protein
MLDTTLSGFSNGDEPHFLGIGRVHDLLAHPEGTPGCPYIVKDQNHLFTVVNNATFDSL